MTSDKNIDSGDPHRRVEHDLPLFSDTSRDEQAKQMGRYADKLKPHNLARSTDPDTSKVAAKKAGDLASRHESLILDCLNTHRRCTAEQIAKYINLSGYPMDNVKVSRRMAKLVLRGLVEDSGERRPTESNRPATVWILAENEEEIR